MIFWMIAAIVLIYAHQTARKAEARKRKLEGELELGKKGKNPHKHYKEFYKNNEDAALEFGVDPHLMNMPDEHFGASMGEDYTDKTPQNQLFDDDKNVKITII